MDSATIYKTPKVILEKLNRLLMTLQRAKRTYEETASTVDNKQLRYSILGLAQESKQYTNELMSQIEILRGKPAKSHGG